MKAEVQLDGALIVCEIETVFAFISEMENGPRWGRTKSTVKSTDGPVSLGTVFFEEAEDDGRTLRKRTEVVEFDPPFRFSYISRYENGMTERAWVIFEVTGDGTLVTPRAEVEMPGAPQSLAPEFSRQMKSAVHGLLDNLKGVLEAPRTPSS